jgi:hypothetical protein
MSVISEGCAITQTSKYHVDGYSFVQGLIYQRDQQSMNVFIVFNEGRNT